MTTTTTMMLAVAVVMAMWSYMMVTHVRVLPFSQGFCQSFRQTVTLSRLLLGCKNITTYHNPLMSSFNNNGELELHRIDHGKPLKKEMIFDHFFDIFCPLNPWVHYF